MAGPFFIFFVRSRFKNWRRNRSACRRKRFEKKRNPGIQKNTGWKRNGSKPARSKSFRDRRGIRRAIYPLPGLSLGNQGGEDARRRQIGDQDYGQAHGIQAAKKLVHGRSFRRSHRIKGSRRAVNRRRSNAFFG